MDWTCGIHEAAGKYVERFALETLREEAVWEIEAETVAKQESGTCESCRV
jgi:hypothetical protein